MTNRIALFLLTSALTATVPLSGAQAKEEHGSSGVTKSSSANASGSNASNSNPPAQSSSNHGSHSSKSTSSSRFSQDDAREALRKGKVMPLASILDIADKRQPGTVIAVDLETRHGRWIYEIDVITEDGRRRELRLDARNGEILAVEDE